MFPKEFHINGKTITIDLYECDPEILQAPEKQLELLLTLPERIGMTIITAPQIARWDAPLCNNREAWGYSGAVLFAESHAYLHTWPEGRFVLFDLTSCSDFDHILVEEIVQAAFLAKRSVPHVVLRGRAA